MNRWFQIDLGHVGAHGRKWYRCRIWLWVLEISAAGSDKFSPFGNYLAAAGFEPLVPGGWGFADAVDGVIKLCGCGSFWSGVEFDEHLFYPCGSAIPFTRTEVLTW
jgi:hypothetical protein